MKNYRMNSMRKHLIFWGMALLLLALTGSLMAAEQQAPPTDTTVVEVPAGEIDSTLAKMSDEQVRALLIQELTQDAQSAEKETVKKPGGMIHRARGWLHILDEKEESEAAQKAPRRSIAEDLQNVVAAISGGEPAGIAVKVGIILAVLCAAFLVELISRRFTADFSRQFEEQVIPNLDGPMRFVAGVMRSLPTFIQICVYSATAVLFFMVLPYSGNDAMRFIFLALLFSIVFYRIIRQLSLICCAPQTAKLRLFPMEDRTAQLVHKIILVVCNYIFISLVFLALVRELGISRPSFLYLSNGAATLLIGYIIVTILKNRPLVREQILRQSEINQTRNWVVEQVANYWHIPTIVYFIMTLAILISNRMEGVQQESPEFLLSLTALPLFLIFDAVGQWVVRASMASLRIYNPDALDDADDEMREILLAAKEKERRWTITAGRTIRLLVLAALMVWALNLWGYHIPYASSIAGAVFESLTAMALGLVTWRFVSSYIERKIAESTPEEDEENKEDDEFGGAVQRGRSFTLLPMVRKVLASVLLVMVILVVLSSLGVDIGPLLAGAGVVGLAVGFGAQKLVSDVFSGFFYLLDDAFRVGEFIEAGSVSGAVEAITLRNVMLRHHRGMLQIVPHSELGSITNYMRGGIIVKFNLEFPYDANVEKIRKVIKKVGQAMLKDEEFADDFIQPVKSAGVREITGSVMTIRVKFKAKSGTHFVIRREAYRRITEALNAKGIFYAHRKVIVELPEDVKSAGPEEQKKALEAGAAAELARLEEEKQAAASSGESTPKPGMPGM